MKNGRNKKRGDEVGKELRSYWIGSEMTIARRAIRDGRIAQGGAGSGAPDLSGYGYAAEGSTLPSRSVKNEKIPFRKKSWKNERNAPRIPSRLNMHFSFSSTVPAAQVQLGPLWAPADHALRVGRRSQAAPARDINSSDVPGTSRLHLGHRLQASLGPPIRVSLRFQRGQ